MTASSSKSANSTDLLVPLDPSRDRDTRELSRYLISNIPELEGEIEYFQFTGGNANLTYLARAQDKEFVLKVEPPGVKARSAHDMRREFKVLSRIHPVYPLSPEPVLLCEDETVFGGVFCVMSRINGRIIRQGDASIPQDLESGCLRRRFLMLVDALAKLHMLDPTSAGFADLEKAKTFRARQVRGWCRRFRQAETEGCDAAEEIIEWLLENEPSTSQRVSVIHNDFKMDNLVWEEDSCVNLIGVLDWEMSTVGDPLMDLACTLSFWSEEADSEEFRSLRAMPSDDRQIPTRSEAMRQYFELTGWEIEHVDFYRCFALFRRAAIEQQKLYRFIAGHSDDPRYANLDAAVRILLESCRKVISG